MKNGGNVIFGGGIQIFTGKYFPYLHAMKSQYDKIKIVIFKKPIAVCRVNY